MSYGISECPDLKIISSLLGHESVDLLVLVKASISIDFLTFV